MNLIAFFACGIQTAIVVPTNFDFAIKNPLCKIKLKVYRLNLLLHFFVIRLLKTLNYNDQKFVYDKIDRGKMKQGVSNHAKVKARRKFNCIHVFY